MATGNPVVFTLSPPECYMEIRYGYGTTGNRVGGPVRVGDPLTLIIYMRSKYGKKKEKQRGKHRYDGDGHTRKFVSCTIPRGPGRDELIRRSLNVTMLFRADHSRPCNRTVTISNRDRERSVPTVIQSTCVYRNCIYSNAFRGGLTSSNYFYARRRIS